MRWDEAIPVQQCSMSDGWMDGWMDGWIRYIPATIVWRGLAPVALSLPCIIWSTIQLHRRAAVVSLSVCCTMPLVASSALIRSARSSLQHYMLCRCDKSRLTLFAVSLGE